MKQLILGFLIFFTIAGCTFTPKESDGVSQNKKINKNLICAKQVDILQISINNALPPKKSFKLYLKKLKKYTTDNIVIHKTVNLSMNPKLINNFIQGYGRERKGFNYLAEKEKKKLKEALASFPKNKSGIVMIYTPVLKCPANPERNLRGYAFGYAPDYSVVAYSETSINKAPLISKTQAWKIVLTHEIGHSFHLPANKERNDHGHCTSRECILYKGPDWRAVLSVPTNGMPYDFCKSCQAELKEAKNSCKE
jgi:hypothetical protein